MRHPRKRHFGWKAARILDLKHFSFNLRHRCRADGWHEDITTFILAILLIYLVLAAQFESFRDPFIVLLGSLPLALAGAMLIPFLRAKGTTINIYTEVGLITLVGLIAKNGILIVEFANVLMEEGKGKFEAALKASATRLRPILMTSVATVVGHMPLIFVTGAGAAARNNIGIVLVTGMAIGTFFTLFVVPAIYVFIKKEHAPQEPPAGLSPQPAEIPQLTGATTVHTL